jgi:hypothetical protein
MIGRMCEGQPNRVNECTGRLAVCGRRSRNDREVNVEVNAEANGEATYRELTANHRELLREWRNRRRREAAPTC